MFSKKIKLTSLAALFAVFSGALVPTQAHAILLYVIPFCVAGDISAALSGENGDCTPSEFRGTAEEYELEAGLCLMFLPLCLMDQHSNGGLTVDSSTLRENGYSDAEIAQIMSDQNRLLNALHSKRMGMKLTPQDNADTLRRDLRNSVPELSNTYIDFLTAELALKP